MEDHVYWVAQHAVLHAFTPQQMEELSAADPTLVALQSYRAAALRSLRRAGRKLPKMEVGSL